MESFSPQLPTGYDPKNPWKFPPQRLVDVMNLLRSHLKTHLDNWSKTYAYPDQRFVAFQELYGAALAGHIQAVFLRDHAADKNWWEQHPELAVKAHPRVIPMVNLGLRDGLQTFLLEFCARKWSDALLQTGLHLGMDSPSARGNEMEMEQILAELELFEWIPLITLIQHTRNVAFYNGKYCHPLKQDATVAYKQLAFHFLHGMEVNKPPQFADDWDLYAFAVSEMANCLDAVFLSEAVQAISKIDSPHLD